MKRNVDDVPPELKRILRERAYFDRKAAEVEAVLRNGRGCAESLVRALFYRILQFFDPDVRELYLVEARARWRSSLNTDAILDDCRYRVKRKLARKGLYW